MFLGRVSVFLAIGLISVPSHGTETLAVPDFEHPSGQSDLHFLGRTLSDALSQPLVERHHFNLVERSRLQEVFREKSLALSGAVNDSADPVSVLAAQDLVLGSFEGNTKSLKVGIRIVRAADGGVLGSLSFEGNLEKVLGEMEAAADQIEGVLHGRAFGFLDLESDPEGLDVFIDGARNGATPLRHARLLAGGHRIELYSQDKLLWRDTINPQPDQTIHRHPTVNDPALRQGFSVAMGAGLALPQTSARPFGKGIVVQAELGFRRGSAALGLRGFLTTPVHQTEQFPIPYGQATEDRALQAAGVSGSVVWNLPELGPFELGLGLEAGSLWTWDKHPLWRTDLSSPTTDQVSLFAGPEVELTWVSGHHLEFFVEGSSPITLTKWERDRIVGQDLFPVSQATNLQVAVDKEPLMLPKCGLGLRVHL